MKSSILLIISVILLALNIYVNIRFCSFRNSVLFEHLSFEKLAKEYSALHNSLVYSIINDGALIDTHINDILSGGTLFSASFDKILVCRISDRFCSSCVSNAIDVFKGVSKDFNQQKIAYFLDCKDSLSLARQIQSFSLGDNTVFNIPQFDNEAEFANYPYFFVMDSSFRILATYFPSKGNNKLDSIFLNKMYNRIDNSYKNTNQTNNTIKIDLGDFKIGEKQSLTYFYSNEGRRIIVDTITTSCECVSAKIDSKEIPKGISSKISITYTADNFGTYFREVYIWERDSDKPITLELIGNAQ